MLDWTRIVMPDGHILRLTMEDWRNPTMTRWSGYKPMSVRNCLPAEGSLAPALTVPTYTREQIKKAIRFDVNSPNSIPRDWVAAACRRAAENATCPVYELQKEHGLLLPPSFWAVERYGRTERPYAGIAATAIARWNG